MNKKNKSGKIFFIICSLILIAVGYFFWYKHKSHQTNSNNTSFNNAVEVTFVNISKQPIQLSIELAGRVAAQRSSQIRPQIEGIIKKVKFVGGSFVKKGQQLYEIDPAIYKPAYESAKSSLKALQAKKERYEILLEQDAISKQEFDDVKAAYDQAKSDVSKAKKNFDYTKVLAPISGYIGKTNYTEGALVTANQSEVLTTITDVDMVYVDMEQPAKDAIDLKSDKKIKVSLKTEDPNYKNIGVLKFSEMFVDESTDSVRLRAAFSNKDKKLLPGMFVTAQLNLTPFEAITVPQRATSRMADGSLMVWIINEEDIAKPRVIKAEKIYQDSWIVLDGLNEGEKIILEGFQKVVDGSKVKPIPLVVEAELAESKPKENKK